jgi:hypothetical protein
MGTSAINYRRNTVGAPGLPGPTVKNNQSKSTPSTGFPMFEYYLLTFRHLAIVLRVCCV